jgi:radical SAM superfamily enzyme YgiQ (UPF0313 family)
VCLVRPPAVETFRIGTCSVVPPLGLAYVAAAAEGAGCRVHVIDAVASAPTTQTRYFQGHLLGLPLGEIAQRVPDEACAIGITCMFTHEWPMVVELVRLLKARRPELPIVVGGEHATATPEFCLATSRADVLALGEGEETAAEIFTALAAGTPLDAIEGIAYRRGEEIVMNRRRARRVDLDDLPWPAWHLFDLRTYHAHRFVGPVYSERLTVPLVATRGCPYQCTYCSSPNMWTTRWVPRDPKKVVDEMEYYVRNWGAGSFPFYDLTAVIQKDWIVAFCREILARGLDVSWQLASGTRSEAIDGEVADLLRRAGMVNMAYAPESGSDETRRYIKKRVQSERLFDSIEAAAQAELSVAAFMVIGFPHDGPEEMRETLAFLREIARRGVNDLGSAYYMALPGTEMFHTLYERGEVTIDRNYFRHILEGLSFIPTTSYSPKLGRAALFYWKLRLVAAFYFTRLRVLGLRNVLASGKQTLSGKSHVSRLQSAVRAALRNGRAALEVRFFGKRWMSRADELALFAPWDEIYREIRTRRRDLGIDAPPPLDTRELQNRNVVRAIKRDHETPRRLPVPSASAAAG